ALKQRQIRLGRRHNHLLSVTAQPHYASPLLHRSSRDVCSRCDQRSILLIGPRSASRLRRRRSASFSTHFLSDPKSLMPEVCPFVGTPGLQWSSWINENKLPFIT